MKLVFVCNKYLIANTCWNVYIYEQDKFYARVKHKQVSSQEEEIWCVFSDKSLFEHLHTHEILHSIKDEPRSENTGLRGFRPGPT